MNDCRDRRAPLHQEQRHRFSSSSFPASSYYPLTHLVTSMISLM
uniref:Uncharacterized protein n=1 Tax=Setaria italica TaxID=4555 RepID=K3XUB6_SETIT